MFKQHIPYPKPLCKKAFPKVKVYVGHLCHDSVHRGRPFLQCVQKDINKPLFEACVFSGGDEVVGNTGVMRGL